MHNPNGFIVFEGPSELTGAPIAVIATGFTDPSANPKTGAMIQVFIIPADVSPTVAAVNGQDDAVCGNCPLRTQINPETGKRERKCYVQPFQAPRAVYDAYRKGRYRKLRTLGGITRVFTDRVVRLGAWGDPAAVPFQVIQAIVARAKRHTGYTHQWETCDPRFQGVIMASVDTAEQYPVAKSAGWRTFRTTTDPVPNAREIICPASEEAGKRTTCAECGLCNGSTAVDVRKDIVILAHGSGRKHFTLTPVSA